MLMAILQRITFTFTSSTTKVPNICNTLAQRPSRCKVFICFPYLAARRIGSNKHTHGYCTISVGFRNPVIFCNTNQLQKADCTESYESFHFFQLFFCWKHISPIIISKKTQLEDFLDHPQLLGLQRYIFRNIRNIPFDSTGHGTKPWRSRLLFFRVFPQIFGLAPDGKLYLQYHWPDLVRIPPQNKIAQSMLIKSHQNATFRSDQLGNWIFPKGTYWTGHSTYNLPTYIYIYMAIHMHV